MEFAEKGEKEMTLSTLYLCKVAKSLIIKELVGTLRLCIAKRRCKVALTFIPQWFSRVCLHFACVWEKGRGAAHNCTSFRNSSNSTNGKRQRQSSSMGVAVVTFSTFNSKCAVPPLFINVIRNCE